MPRPKKGVASHKSYASAHQMMAEMVGDKTPTDDFAKTCIGVSEIAKIMAKTLGALLGAFPDKSNTEYKEAAYILQQLGGVKNVSKFAEHMRQKFPEVTSTSVIGATLSDPPLDLASSTVPSATSPSILSVADLYAYSSPVMPQSPANTRKRKRSQTPSNEFGAQDSLGIQRASSIPVRLRLNKPLPGYPIVVKYDMGLDSYAYAVVAGLQYMLFRNRECAHEFADFHHLIQEKTVPCLALQQSAAFAGFSGTFVMHMNPVLVIPDETDPIFKTLLADVEKIPVFMNQEILTEHLIPMVEEYAYNGQALRRGIPIFFQRHESCENIYARGSPVAIPISDCGDPGPLSPQVTNGDLNVQEISATDARNREWGEVL